MRTASVIMIIIMRYIFVFLVIVLLVKPDATLLGRIIIFVTFL